MNKKDGEVQRILQYDSGTSAAPFLLMDGKKSVGLCNDPWLGILKACLETCCLERLVLLYRIRKEREKQLALEGPEVYAQRDQTVTGQLGTMVWQKS